jgi:hypothetical protein
MIKKSVICTTENKFRTGQVFMEFIIRNREVESAIKAEKQMANSHFSCLLRTFKLLIPIKNGISVDEDEKCATKSPISIG